MDSKKLLLGELKNTCCVLDFNLYEYKYKTCTEKTLDIFLYPLRNIPSWSL
jgi:hypothetical protein